MAKEHPVEADVVIGVPDSGLDAALGYAQESGIPYGMGFVKNRYIARTFIQPEQGQRENSVRIKLNALASVVKGKRVIMVDDSIVRGTTSAPDRDPFAGRRSYRGSCTGISPAVYQPLLLRHRHRLQGKPDCLPDE